MMSVKRIVVYVVFCLLAGLPALSPAQAQDSETQEFRRGEIVVEIKPGASIEALNGRHRTTTIERISGTNFFRLQTPQGKSEEKWQRRVVRDRDVISASLNPMVTNPTSVFARATVAFPGSRATPGHTRTDYLLQPSLFHLLSLGDAQLRSRGAGMIVAVIDTGVAPSHPDLVSRMWRDNRRGGEVKANGVDDDGDGFVDDAYGWDFVDNDNYPTETADKTAGSVAGHGSFIAGLITLIAPECRIMPVRAFTPDGISNAFTVAAAIKYAVDHGANVINLSFGSPKKSGIVRDAIRYARQRGVVLVAAMGNEGQDTDRNPQYPANWGEVIGIAALDADSRRAAFSNYGSRVSVAALGENLVSTYPGAGGRSGDYAMWNGTSFAAPLTTAQVALVLAESRGGDARRTIEETADAIDHLNPDFSGKLGKGRINLLAALESLYSATIPAGNYATLALSSDIGEGAAQGKADLLSTGPLQQFLFTASALKARGTYTLMINGRDLTPGGFTATNFGGLVIELSNEPTRLTVAGRIQVELPPELTPVTKIRHLELREGGRVVLEGHFTSIASGTGEAVQLYSKRAPLSPTGALPKAEGKASVVVGLDRKEIEVEGNKLTPGAVYKVYADGVEIGAAVAQSAGTRSGFLRLRLTAGETSGLGIPPTLQPITDIRQVEVRDSSDQVILRGDFLPGGDGS